MELNIYIYVLLIDKVSNAKQSKFLGCYSTTLGVPRCLNHTLSIWLEMEFTGDIFFKTSVCADSSQYILKTNKINIFMGKSLRKSFLEDIY